MQESVCNYDVTFNPHGLQVYPENTLYTYIRNHHLFTSNDLKNNTDPNCQDATVDLMA